MKKFSYVITDELGIHARPAGLLVKEAAKFTSNITLKCGDKSGDAKRIFGIMGMGIKKGNEVTVEAEGSDEDAAIAGLADFFKNNL
ncbi:MAG: Phosphotransferase system, phosphocarrier protein HPr [Anaerocolumna sp.]|jgi:phosphocarrier protein|nr:Phosphotransferase system, phosphocarrier protein HPr [Anaerocolumna sp.]